MLRGLVWRLVCLVFYFDAWWHMNSRKLEKGTPDPVTLYWWRRFVFQCQSTGISVVVMESWVIWTRLIPRAKWHSCLHNGALCSFLATLRLLRQRENHPQFSGTMLVSQCRYLLVMNVNFGPGMWKGTSEMIRVTDIHKSAALRYALICIVTRLISDVHIQHWK